MHAHNTRTPRGRVAGTADPAPYAVEIAASLQNTRNGSLVIWSSWRQTYTAFSAITPDPHIIDEASVHRLLNRIDEVELTVSVSTTGAPHHAARIGRMTDR